MRRIGKTLTVMLLIVAMCALLIPSVSVSADASQKEFFVATNGDDNNPGTIDAPFATLEKARDTIRGIKAGGDLPAGGIRVYLREGTYNLEKSFELTKEDSGTAECPITYTAYEGEKAVISGGYDLDTSKFSLVKDKAVLEKIPKSAQKKVYEFNLGAIGIKNFPKVRSFGWGYTPIAPEIQLMINGVTQSIARYPNEGHLKTGTVKEQGKTNDVALPEYNETLYTTSGGIFYYDDSELDKLAGVKDVLAWGYWQEGNWSTNDIIIRTIDTKEKTITLDGPTAFGLRPDRDYYVYNALELLDNEGEWYVDRENAMLYVIPTGDIKSSKVQLNKADFNLVNMKETKYITFSDLDFTMTLMDAIYMENGENNLVRNCEIYTTAGNGVTINCDTKNVEANNGVIDSEMYDIGLTCISITAGNRKMLKPGNCFAINNKLHDFGVIRLTYEGGVALKGCGNIARYNEIYDGPHLAISIDGNDQIVEYNDIHNVVKVSNDSGAIYSYGQNSYLGFQINANYWHDIKSDKESGAGVMAIYMDDFIGGATITQNIINNVDNTGIFLKGKYITAKYNIIKDTSRALFLSDFDIRYGNYDQPGSDQRVPNMDKANEANGFYSDIWNKAYPFWPDLHDLNGDDNGGTTPSDNEIVDNVLINGNASVESVFGANSNINNKTMKVDEVGFVDAANGNFSLAEGAGIFTKISGFPNIAFNKMGMYTNRFDEINKNQVSLKTNSPIAFAKGKKTKVDPENANVMPVIIESRTLVPVRFIAESFGAGIHWDPDTGTATISLDGKNIKMTINSTTMDVDGTTSELEVPAQSIEGRTMIPLRALVETLGKKVMWDERGLISIGDSETPFGDQSELVDALVYNFR